MSRIIDMVGKKFDMIYVKARAPDYVQKNGRHRLAYLCDCDCGTKDIVITGEVLRNNGFHSCGCHRRELLRVINVTHGDTHKGNWNRLYRIWSLMKDRCSNPNSPAYKDYGARGICFCDEWKSYPAFKSWALSNGYDETMTIERIDVNGNYCPSNCTWIPKSQQSRNRRNNVYITIGDKTLHLSEWGRIYHIQPSTIAARIKSGWRDYDAVVTPVAKRSNNAVV